MNPSPEFLGSPSTAEGEETRGPLNYITMGPFSARQTSGRETIQQEEDVEDLWLEVVFPKNPDSRIP